MQEHKKIYLVLSVVMIFLLTGCSSHARESEKNSPPQDTLAIIGDRVITLPEFKERCDAMTQRDPRLNDSEERKKYLDMLIRTTLFSLEARAEHIDKEKQVADRINDATDWILYNKYLQKEIRANANITDEQIKIYYDANLDEFKTVEKVKVSHILIRVYPTSGPDGLAKAKARAKKLKQELDQGADFAVLAQNNSDDSATRNQGGSLGYITRGKMMISSEFTDAAFSLKSGKISDPVESPHGFHIIKADAKVPEQVSPLDHQVETYIKNTLGKEKQKQLTEELTDRLKEKYNVVIKSHDLDW